MQLGDALSHELGPISQYLARPTAELLAHRGRALIKRRMHKGLADVEQIDHIISTGGGSGDRGVEDRDPGDGGPIAGTGAAFNQQAGTELAQGFLT